MEYKTVIEIVSEAENPTDAADIAGEYLRGNLDRGIQMKCRTKAVKGASQVKYFSVALILLAGLSLSAFSNMKQGSVDTESFYYRNVSTIQPPLRSSAAYRDLYLKNDNAEPEKNICR